MQNLKQIAWGLVMAMFLPIMPMPSAQANLIMPPQQNVEEEEEEEVPAECKPQEAKCKGIEKEIKKLKRAIARNEARMKSMRKNYEKRKKACDNGNQSACETAATIKRNMNRLQTILNGQYQKLEQLVADLAECEKELQACILKAVAESGFKK